MKFVTPESMVRAPAPQLRALEVRAVFERLAMAASGPSLDLLPGGDDHPILVLPGFSGGDRSTAPLRRSLNRIGYRAFGWGLGNNIGPTPEILSGIPRRLLEIAEKEGRKVTLVGWSLGGIYSREMARLHPDVIRQVITLGSPIQLRDGDRTTASALWDARQDLFDLTAFDRSIPEHERPPLEVPSTSIYTRTDGIVHWRTCLTRELRISENVEVLGSHCGLGFNPSVLYVVADRLAQAEGEWARFRPHVWLRGIFPRPAHWRPRSHRRAA